MSDKNQNQESETGYDIWSSFYDSYMNPTVSIDDLSFPKFYAEVREQKVFEVGCGTGRHTLRLLEAKNEVTGIDVSSGMLSRLKEKINSESLNLIKGDFLKEPLKKGYFDSIVASLVLEHIDNLNFFFLKSSQILKPGGRIYLSELHPFRTAQGTFAHFKNVDGFDVHLQSTAHTEKAIYLAAKLNGFRVYEVKTIVGNHELIRVNSHWKKYLGKPMIQIWVFFLNQNEKPNQSITNA